MRLLWSSLSSRVDVLSARLAILESFSNDDGEVENGALQKNQSMFHLQLSQLRRSAQYACRSKKMLRLSM